MKNRIIDLIGAGMNPFFLYDIDLLRSAIERERERSQQRLCFKVKNNPNPSVLAELKNCIDEFWIETDDERNLLETIGVSSEQIVKNQSSQAVEISPCVMACGFYGTEVLARKWADWGPDILIVHGGLQHLGRTYLFSQVRTVDVLRSQDPLIDVVCEFNISGSLCLGNDTLHPKMLAPQNVRRGDWVVFPNSGILGVTAGTPYFIGQGLPREFILKGGQLNEVTLRQFRLYHDSF